MAARDCWREKFFDSDSAKKKNWEEGRKKERSIVEFPGPDKVIRRQ